jgi:hypothetical protein
MLVKFPCQLVYIFARIDFLSNQALNEQNKEKTDITPFAAKIQAWDL